MSKEYMGILYVLGKSFLRINMEMTFPSLYNKLHTFAFSEREKYFLNNYEIKGCHRYEMSLSNYNFKSIILILMESR